MRKTIEILSNTLTFMKKTISHVCFFFILCLIVCTQKNIFLEPLSRAEAIMLEQPDSSLWILEHEINPELLSAKEYADWCLFITQARNKTYVEHTSDSLIRHAAEYYEKQNNSEKLILAYYYMGRVAYDMHLVLRAQEYYKKALDAGKASSDYFIIGLISNHLGILYTYQHAYDLALPYFKKARFCYEQINEVEGIVFALRDIARVYHHKNQLDSAQYYYKETLKYKYSHSSILNELGGLLIGQQEYDAVLPLLYQSMEYVPEEIDLHPVYLTLGQFYLETELLDSALFYLNKSLASPLLRTQAASSSFLAKLFVLQKDWEKAALLKDRYVQLRDSIERMNSNRTIQLTEAMYNFQQREAKQYKLQNTITKQFFLSLTLVMVIVIAVLIMYFVTICRQKNFLERFINRQRSNNKKQLQINKKRLTELKEGLSKKAMMNKAVLKLEEQLLFSENKRIEQELEKQKQMQKQLLRHEIFKKFYDDKEKITVDDIDVLKQVIDSQYPNFNSRLHEYGLYTNKDTCCLCYLLKANFKISRIGEIMNKAKQTISKRRGVLSEMIREKEAPLKTLDEVIFFE